jgi:MFS family permease
LIPFNLFISVGAVLSNIISGKLKLLPIYVCWLGALLETVGIGLMITLPTDTHSPALLYFFEILAGIGIGLLSGISIAMPPYILDKSDQGNTPVFEKRLD